MKYASSRLSAVQPSASAFVSQNAKALRAEGHDVIDLGLGEPDFDTPGHIIEAAHSAALAGQTRYPPTQGTQTLREAVIAKFERDNGLSFELNQIIVSTGAKQVIFDALMASLEPNDQVLMCAPYFGQYKDMVLILGGEPRPLECAERDGFCVTPELLEHSITPSTRWLMINLPSNPAGTVYEKKQLTALGEVLARHPHVLVLSDEIYEHILFDDRTFTSFARACPELAARVLTVNGVSKAYAMTGWRIGYAAGPEPLIEAMIKVQSQITSGACSVAQAAAVEALAGPQDEVTRFNAAFERRRNLIVERVALIDGLTLDPPGGAFYAFIGCAGFINSTMPDGTLVKDDNDFVRYLLNDAKVAAVPGSAYGMSPYFRLSTATSEQQLTKAMDRIESSVKKLKLQSLER